MTIYYRNSLHTKFSQVRRRSAEREPRLVSPLQLLLSQVTPNISLKVD